MKAIMIKRYGGPEVLELVDLPAPTPKDGEVIVKVAATSVNPVDWRIRDGDAKDYVRLKLPGILGCDLAGEIAAVGKDVTRFAVGDPVFAMMPHDWGAHAELVPLAEDMVVKKPARLTMEEAAATPVAAMTALMGLRKRGQVKPGQHVLVNGASSAVGMAAVQIAKALGASVTAVCSEASFDLVRGLGADQLIDYRTTDFAAGDDRYDLVFDCIGNHPHGACARVLTGSRVHVTTMPGIGTFVRQLFNPLFGVKVFGLITTGSGAELEFIRSLVESGKLRTVVDKVYPFADVARAQEYSKTGRAKGKIVLTLAAS